MKEATQQQTEGFTGVRSAHESTESKHAHEAVVLTACRGWSTSKGAGQTMKEAAQQQTEGVKWSEVHASPLKASMRMKQWYLQSAGVVHKRKGRPNHEQRHHNSKQRVSNGQKCTRVH